MWPGLDRIGQGWRWHLSFGDGVSHGPHRRKGLSARTTSQGQGPEVGKSWYAEGQRQGRGAGGRGHQWVEGQAWSLGRSLWRVWARNGMAETLG